MKKLSFILIITLITGLIYPVSFAKDNNTASVSREFKYVLFENGFENQPTDTKPPVSTGNPLQWTSVGDVSVPYQVQTIDDNGNNVCRLSRNDDNSDADSPCIVKFISTNSTAKVNIRFKLKTFGEYFELQTYNYKDDGTSRVVTKPCVFMGDDVVLPGPLTGKVSSDEFMTVDVCIDFSARKCTTYINDIQYLESAEFETGTDFSKGYYLRFQATPRANQYVYLDDVRITTNDESLLDVRLVDLEKLQSESEDEIVPLFKKTHPKIYVNNFQTIRDKIESDPLCRKWFDSLKSAADNYLNAEPEPYEPDSSLALSPARRIRYKLHILGFMYGITEDVRYKDRAMKEMIFVGDFPSWAGYLASAEITSGFAVAYDWIYNALTDEEKQIIVDIVLKHGFYYAAMSYEGISESHFVHSASNQNLACNGCYMQAAIAFSDELPVICEYILDRGAESIPTGIGIMAPLGASPEGYGYWDYTISNLFQICASLESALADGNELPEKYIFYNYPGISQTIDYPIAMRSTYGAFNYGDADIGSRGNAEFSFSYWASKKYNKPEYTWYQLNKNDLNGSYGPVWRITHKLSYYEPSDMELMDASFPLDKAFISEDATNLASLRSSWAQEGETYVGLQGGSGGISHMFQSHGTFVIDSLGERFVTMRGRGDYDWAGYFDIEVQKWNYYTARTEGQNCVVINPDKGPGQDPQSVAKIKALKSGIDEAFASIDLSEAYAQNTDSYTRGIKLFNNRKYVLVQDDIKAKAPIRTGYWFVHTDSDVMIDDDGKAATLFKNGKRMRVQIVSAFDDAKLYLTKAEPLPTSPNPEIQQTVDYGHKLAIDLAGQKDFTLAVAFIPLADGEYGPDLDIGITPVDEWQISEEYENYGGANNIVAMCVNSPYYIQNEEKDYIDSQLKEKTAPVIKSGRTLIPLRFISEVFGAEVSWNGETEIVTIRYKDKEISLKIGDEYMYVNGEAVELEVSAELINERTYVPIRAVSDALDVGILWKDGLICVGSETVEESLAQRFKSALFYELSLNDEIVSGIDVKNGECNLFSSPDSAENTVNLKTYYPFVKNEKKIINNTSDSAEFTLDTGIFTVNLKEDKYLYFGGKKALKDIYITSSQYEDRRNEKNYLIPHKITATAENAAIYNLYDNRLDTQWSAQGINSFVIDFGEVKNLYSVGVAADSKGNVRRSTFKIEISDNALDWHEIMSDTQTDETLDMPQIFELGNACARYVRVTGSGNSINDYNNYNEFKFYESLSQLEMDKACWNDNFARVNWSDMKPGDKLNLSARAYLNDGTVGDLSDAEIIYSSSDSAVANVTKDGQLSILAQGTATIYTKIIYHGFETTINTDIISR